VTNKAYAADDRNGPPYGIVDPRARAPLPGMMLDRFILAAALLCLASGCGRGETPTAAKRPNVLLITLDTTRADHLGCYGYERDTSPNLDRLAAEALLYERAFSTTSWTLPAHASLFTGKFTSSHGARYDPGGPLRLTSGITGPAEWNDYRARGLSPGETTLAGTLRAAGYATAGVVAGPWMKRVFGLDAGFEHYDDDQVHTLSGRLASEVTNAALGWLARLDGERPFFLFLNYYDAHSPFEAPEPFKYHFLSPEARARGAKGGRDLVAMYDGEILYADLHMGRLFDEMRARGLWDDTLVIVTADHGELLGEHGRWGHGQTLSQQELHVPLIVRDPGGTVPPGRSLDPIQLVDVGALVLARLDLPLPPRSQGGGAHPVVAEVYPLERFAPGGSWRALIEWPHKYVRGSRGQVGLFDLEADPGESHDLTPGEAARSSRMQGELEAYLGALPLPGPAGPEAAVDPALSESLHSLGYMDGLDGE